MNPLKQYADHYFCLELGASHALTAPPPHLPEPLPERGLSCMLWWGEEQMEGASCRREGDEPRVEMRSQGFWGRDSICRSILVSSFITSQRLSTYESWEEGVAVVLSLFENPGCDRPARPWVVCSADSRLPPPMPKLRSLMHKEKDCFTGQGGSPQLQVPQLQVPARNHVAGCMCAGPGVRAWANVTIFMGKTTLADSCPAHCLSLGCGCVSGHRDCDSPASWCGFELRSQP